MPDTIVASVALTQEAFAKLLEERLRPWADKRARLVAERLCHELFEEKDKQVRDLVRRLERLEKK